MTETCVCCDQQHVYRWITISNQHGLSATAIGQIKFREIVYLQGELIAEQSAQNVSQGKSGSTFPVAGSSKEESEANRLKPSFKYANIENGGELHVNLMPEGYELS